MTASRAFGAIGAWITLLIVAGCGTPASGENSVSAAPLGSSSPAVAPSSTPQPSPPPVPLPVSVVGTIESGAQATTTAARAASHGVDFDCDLALAARIGAAHPEVGQLIVVRTAGWSATTGAVDVVRREVDGSWSCERGNQPAMVGRNGTRLLIERRSGDGTTPAGLFPLGTNTAWDGDAFQFFGNGADPGVRGAYRRVTPEDCWGATPGDPAYGHLVNHPDCPGPDDEYLQRIGDVYVHAAVIGANPEPTVSGDAPGETPYAAAIFLHRHNYGAGRNSGTARPTSGCVSLAIDDLIGTLQLIDPAAHPYFAIGPADSWS